MSTPAPHPGFKVAIVLLTAAMLTATHWPGLAIHGPFSRTDLFIHAGIFATWSTLFTLATRLRLGWVLLIGAAYAVFDETTQPIFHRVFDWTDMAADGAGIVLGAVFGGFLRHRLGRSAP